MKVRSLGVDLIAWLYIVLAITAIGAIYTALILLAAGELRYEQLGKGGMIGIVLIVALMVFHRRAACFSSSPGQDH